MDSPERSGDRQMATVVSEQHDCYARPIPPGVPSPSSLFPVSLVIRAPSPQPTKAPANVASQSRSGAADSPNVCGTRTNPVLRSAAPASKTGAQCLRISCDRDESTMRGDQYPSGITRQANQIQLTTSSERVPSMNHGNGNQNVHPSEAENGMRRSWVADLLCAFILTPRATYRPLRRRVSAANARLETRVGKASGRAKSRGRSRSTAAPL
jgi:hypothetical protein